MAKEIDATPQPKYEINTISNLGYELNSAVADLIDNSIAAKPKNIDIICKPIQSHNDKPRLIIKDDGHGMSPSELAQNLRLSCKDPYINREKGDLGRFREMIRR